MASGLGTIHLSSSGHVPYMDSGEGALPPVLNGTLMGERVEWVICDWVITLDSTALPDYELRPAAWPVWTFPGCRRSWLSCCSQDFLLLLFQ